MLWPSITAFIISLVLTPIIRDIFHSYNVVDRPGFRKLHAYPIPRLGGIAIAVAYVIALIRVLGSATVSAVPNDAVSSDDDLLWKLLPGAGVILLTGILDDFFNLTAAYKLVGQLAAFAVAFWTGLRIETIAGVALPMAVSLALTIFWLLLSTNAFNLIDGLDGLCTVMGCTGTAALFAAASIQGNVPLQQATLPLIGALLGFLFYNFSRATMFLGDSGALLIGYLVGCYGIMYTAQATALGALVPVMVIAVPLMDLSLSVVRRFMTNRPIFAADQGHIHHRLLDCGFTPRRVILVLLRWAMAGALFALLLSDSSELRWQGFIVFGFCATAWVGVRELRYPEFNVAAQLLIGGGFRQTLREKARVRNLADALERCATEDEWWDLLIKAGREAGWFRVVWMQDRSIRREQVFQNQAQPGWSLNLPLADGESLQIAGGIQPTDRPLDLMAFAQAVHGSFDARRRVWERPALS
jgi:UDP-GlcNAc:undecaprenyl-phosphate GlcNAc-1-phosphate transferase